MTTQLNFWRRLPRPVYVLAPMVGVTDAAYRRTFARYGKPDVMFTEFVSVDGICSPGQAGILRQLQLTEAERPLVAQLYGALPENFRVAARFVADLGFDGIDLNMGCPAKDVEKYGAGAALIKQPCLAREIIEAARDGAAGLPVSVKTRIGYRTSEIESWLAQLVAAGPAAITLHARTRNEMSKVPARWGVVRQAVELARALQPDDALRPLIIGNGDVDSLAAAAARVAETGCDGVMVGRGTFGNPWFFNRNVSRDGLPQEQILSVMLEHTALFLELFGNSRPFEVMKKHFKAYVGGFDGAARMRARLMAAEDFGEVEALVGDILRGLDAQAVEPVSAA
jgi:nifR3 family TIM-barrel protein